MNSRKELAEVTAILNTRRVDELMAAGVTIVDPASTAGSTHVGEIVRPGTGTDGWRDRAPTTPKRPSTRWPVRATV